jgi:hypothetical protein
MSFTETTRTSWFARLKNGVVGIFIGLILVFGMIWLLAWNEGRSVKTYRALVEGAGAVVDVDSGAVEAGNEGKLVHIAGRIDPVGTPTDSLLEVSANGAAGLRRSVEMYQWVEEKKSETRKTLGGGEETVTTYSYAKEWRSDRADSADFRDGNGHQNPEMPLSSERFTVERAMLGAFSVDGRAVADLGRDSPVKMADADLQRVADALDTNRPVKTDGQTIFVSADRQNPAVGDLRIGFTREDTETASFVAAQNGGSLAPYRTSNGRDLFLSSAGIASAAEMFDAAQSENTLITWLVRVGGLIGLFIGFTLMLSLISIIADVIPVLGSVVAFGTGIIAAILTLIIGPLVIAIAWFAYRPLLSLAIFAVGALVAFGIGYLRAGKAKPLAAGVTA